jgi:menaquinone-dependent protoporphyrinogen oxidase
MKVLIGYASGYGSTKSYAEVVAEELRGAGHEVTVAEARQAGDITGYDHVIIGGSLRAGSLLGQARKLAKQVVKADKPHHLFICCLSPTTEEGRKSFTEETLPKLKDKLGGANLDDLGLFPGQRNMDEYGFIVRGIMKSIAEKGGVENPEEPKDYRDFELAREWSRGLAAKLG